uniref:Transposase n=1 Tax=Ditylenchus dipsaci TaxID=166011 RepID=A0A915E8A0_9BILA
MQAFCLVWTTPRLRGLQSRAKSFQVDTTYKLNWNRFPVMVCGFSDAKRKFFCTHLALWMLARVLIADGDKTITTAAQIVWPECYRAMCFAHVKMNLLKKLRPKILANVKGLMSSDLSFLQTASSESEFKRASDLMEIDWSSKFGQQVKAMEVEASLQT